MLARRLHLKRNPSVREDSSRLKTLLERTAPDDSVEQWAATILFEFEWSRIGATNALKQQQSTRRRQAPRVIVSRNNISPTVHLIQRWVGAKNVSKARAPREHKSHGGTRKPLKGYTGILVESAIKCEKRRTGKSRGTLWSDVYSPARYEMEHVFHR